MLALPAGGIAALRGFDGLYGQDAYAYFAYSTASVRQSITHLAPLEPFYWPPGYPLLVAIVTLVAGPTPLAGQVVSLVLGALTPVFTFLLARELWPEERLLAVQAGVLVAVCGQLWQSSVVVMADTTGLALATLSAWALARSARHHQLRWLLIASAAIVYATLARWIYGLVAAPFAIYAVLALRKTSTRQAVAQVLSSLGVLALIVIPLLGPPLLASLSRPSEPPPFTVDFQVYSWSPVNAVQREFFTIDGHLSYSLPNGVYYAVAPANPAFFGQLLAPWIVLGLIAAIREWRRPTLLLIVGWAGLVYAFHAGAPWQNFRFTLAYLPPLAILAAAGLIWAWRRVDRPVQTLITGCAALGILVAAGSAVRLVEGFIDRKEEELALVRWVQSQTPPTARLFSFGPTLTFRHYTNFPTFDLFDLTPTDIAAVLASAAPTYVLLDERNVEEQWLARPPSTNFHLLRDRSGLTPLGVHGNYTLYRVDST